MGALRLFLALVVAHDHWRLVMLAPRGLQTDEFYKLNFTGSAAVFFFYVISGFLISFTLHANYTATPAGITAFWRARFARIFSLYWPALAVSVLLFAGPAIGWFDRLVQVILFGMDWRLTFGSYPLAYWQAVPPGIPQAWTLGAELTFYLVAPWLARSRIAIAVALAASLVLRAWLLATMQPPPDVWIYHFAPATFCFFMIGCAAFHLGERVAELRRPWFGLLAVAASLAIMAMGRPTGGIDEGRVWASLAFFAIGLPGFFAATKDWRVSNLLGDLSYPVYIVHYMVLLAFGAAIFGAMPGLASIAPFLAAVVIVAALSHWLVEMPVSRLFSERRRRPAPQAP